MNTTNEEEYTDYSCSTALEGLSRDVETILRTWHVDRGSDRHVTNFSSSRSHAQLTRQSDDLSSKLIRSNTIIWNFSVTDKAGGRSSVTMDLELCLWDTPGDIMVTDESEEKEMSTLVRSLRRSPFATMSSHDYLFDNFSTLFGIGQHISLSPIQTEPMPSNLSEYLGSTLLQRHDDTNTISWVLASTLSGWLQTALNCAVSNCQCCIPAFGIWGEYRPNVLLPQYLNRRNSLGPGSSNQSITNSSRRAMDSNQSYVSDSTDMLLGKTIHTQASNSAAEGVNIFPKWIDGVRRVTLPTVGRKYKQKAQAFWNSRFIPPVITGTVIRPGSRLEQPATSATMSISVVSSSHQSKIAKRSRLSIWASILLEQCDDPTVILCGARHVFGWFKPRLSHLKKRNLFRSYQDILLEKESQAWRQASEFVFDADSNRSEEEAYRQHCRAHALDVLDDAWGSKDRNVPMFGPIDDPVASVYVTTTWNGSAKNDNGVQDSILAFPLRIRSKREMSKRDYLDMEESMEKAVLDPLSPTRFTVQVYFDRETSVATLAANQRCVLAALVRAATLPGETLLQHLTEEELVACWDDNAGTVVASKLVEKAKLGNATRQLVEVMEWSSLIEDMISIREAEAIVHTVMNGRLTAAFPDSPDSFVETDDMYTPFKKSAPFGRLVSVLFAEMAKLRALSSMALVWGVFVDELRRRWEMRESLPNMQYVPGLDPHPSKMCEDRKFSSIALKADLAAFLNCSEPDPDDYNCLIGQKLQVFNLGVECIVASELIENEAMEKFLDSGKVPSSAAYEDRHRPSAIENQNKPDVSIDDLEVEIPGQQWMSKDGVQGATDGKRNYGPPIINADLEFWVMDEPGHHAQMDEAFDRVHKASEIGNDDPLDFSSVNHKPSMLESYDDTLDFKAQPLQLNMQKQVDRLPSSDEASLGSTIQFFDAAEAGSIFSMRNGYLDLDTGVMPADTVRRPGARCPVQGAMIADSGDQIYAPYLQRPSPLTDDIVVERRTMLADRGEKSEKKRQAALLSRLDIAQRLQKPKLYSDMCAFKAANPGSKLDDFAKWYGNPADPLSDYTNQQHSRPPNMQKMINRSAGTKLDRASEAMRILTSTRSFWTKTWESAKPIPASEQEPLFDYAMTVEMVIDFLGQMHPVSLVNQVMAVNLSSAYFTLMSAAEACQDVRLVKAAMEKLRYKTDKALKILSKDSLGESMLSVKKASKRDSASVSHASTTSIANRFVSVEALKACEDACDALGIAETMVSRATSLLHKFPGQYTLVQDLLRLPDGVQVPLTDPNGRQSILKGVQQQQKGQQDYVAASETSVQPVMREYVFRNLNEGNPCQLSVRFGSKDNYLDRVDKEGGVLLALLKSYKD
ncbi:unnamed protein product [Cylindrotheca closterium]|uniref:Rab3 GTPase-activating protein catalytic subunit n=1 Tax=Cylindrotheca closterium TaxID=2856 RepID=A0AAD2G405_9STRA|nr:unnamed protein product [Cylindrotheca closterium]